MTFDFTDNTPWRLHEDTGSLSPANVVWGTTYPWFYLNADHNWAIHVRVVPDRGVPARALMIRRTWNRSAP